MDNNQGPVQDPNSQTATNQSTQKTVVSDVAAQNTQQSNAAVSVPAQDQQNVQKIVEPVSSPHKEGMPTVQTEHIKPAEIEPVIHPEVKEAGVETYTEKPVLDQEHVKIGVTHSPDSTSVPTQPSGIINLPLTERQATNVVKVHKKVSDSVTWLAVLVLRQIKRMRNTRTTTNN